VIDKHPVWNNSAGSLIRETRINKGLSIKDVAVALSMRVSTISQIEAGRLDFEPLIEKPTLQMLSKVTNFLIKAKKEKQ